MEFIKMQGLGNDFILIDDRKEKLNLSYKDLAKKICNRRFGVGADGLVILKKSKKADFKMIIINRDGSEAEMCGNAIRCLSKYLIVEKYTNSSTIKIETLSGIKYIEILKNKLIRVNMGKPSYLGKDIKLLNKESLINEELIFNEEKVRVTALNMGVPHCVLINTNYKTDFGKVIEKNNLFIEGINVNFVELINRKEIFVKTWERGVGETLSCGTGMCAAFSVLNRLKLVEDEVLVRALGGSLNIEINKDDVYMTGDASFICKGDFVI